MKGLKVLWTTYPEMVCVYMSTESEKNLPKFHLNGSSGQF